MLPKLETVLHNAHPKRNIGSTKRGEPSEATSGEPINVVHVSNTFALLLTTAVIFRRIGSYDRYRKRGLHLPMDEKKRFKVQGCSHKRNTKRECKHLYTTQRLIYLFILSRNEGLPQNRKYKLNTQIHV